MKKKQQKQSRNLDLFKCSLADTVVHNIQSGSVSLQLTKDVGPTQTFSVYLVMKDSLKKKAATAVSDTQDDT